MNLKTAVGGKISIPSCYWAALVGANLPRRGKFAPTKLPTAFYIMNKSLTYGLLLSILMVVAPHADHLPLWVSMLCTALLLWRAWLAYSGNPLPKRWLLLL